MTEEIKHEVEKRASSLDVTTISTDGKTEILPIGEWFHCAAGDNKFLMKLTCSEEVRALWEDFLKLQREHTSLMKRCIKAKEEYKGKQPKRSHKRGE